MKYRCIHNSWIKSVIGSIEGTLYNSLKTYRKVDKIICPSEFMNRALSFHSVLRGKTVTLHNFIDEAKDGQEVEKKEYVVYFGRYSEEKGVKTLLEVCRHLPEVSFVFAGSGPLKEEIGTCPNIRDTGFLSGEELKKMVQEARFVVFPSE